MEPTINVHGIEIPRLGFGTYSMAREALLRVLPTALNSGFNHIDTAQIYRNEADVGECIERSGRPRRELFLTTKVWVANYAPAAFGRSVDQSLQRLRTDYLDLLLLHWPHDGVPLADQIGALNEAVDTGKARAIGVSNFTANLVTDAARLSKHPLATNQVEFHPYLNQGIVFDATRRAGMTLTAYCAMAVGRVFSEPSLQAIATDHLRTVAQVVLRWILQHEDSIVLSRSTSPQRAADNAGVFDFELSANEMSEINSLIEPHGRIVDPPGLAPAWDATPAA